MKQIVLEVKEDRYKQLLNFLKTLDYVKLVPIKKMGKKAEKNHNVKWIQLWDVDGIESKKLFINAFPTNFLLDKSGKIVVVNLKSSDLEKFLATKL